MKENYKKFNFWLVVIDETEYWHLESTLMERIERIESVYLVDRQEMTYLPEMTPSYYLHLVETRAILKDEFEPTGDETAADRELEDMRETIKNEIRREMTGENIYVHCRDLQQRIRRGRRRIDYRKWKCERLDLDLYDDIEEIIKANLEYLRGNQMI